MGHFLFRLIINVQLIVISVTCCIFYLIIDLSLKKLCEKVSQYFPCLVYYPLANKYIGNHILTFLSFITYYVLVFHPLQCLRVHLHSIPLPFFIRPVTVVNCSVWLKPSFSLIFFCLVNTLFFGDTNPVLSKKHQFCGKQKRSFIESHSSSTKNLFYVLKLLSW